MFKTSNGIPKSFEEGGMDLPRQRDKATMVGTARVICWRRRELAPSAESLEGSVLRVVGMQQTAEISPPPGEDLHLFTTWPSHGVSFTSTIVITGAITTSVDRFAW